MCSVLCIAHDVLLVYDTPLHTPYVGTYVFSLVMID